MPTGTNTLFFIDKKDIPKNKKPTYVRVVCANRPKKTNPTFTDLFLALQHVT
jgi:hypothetical protein